MTQNNTYVNTNKHTHNKSKVSVSRYNSTVTVYYNIILQLMQHIIMPFINYTSTKRDTVSVSRPLQQYSNSVLLYITTHAAHYHAIYKLYFYQLRDTKKQVSVSCYNSTCTAPCSSLGSLGQIVNGTQQLGRFFYLFGRS